MGHEGLGHRRVLRDRGVVATVVAFVLRRRARCGCGRLASPSSPGLCAGCAMAEELWDRGHRQLRVATSD